MMRSASDSDLYPQEAQMMWRQSLVRLASTLGLVAALGVAGAPAAQAQQRGDDHHQGGASAQRDEHDRGGQDGGRGQDSRGPDQGDRGRDQGNWDGNRDGRDRGQYQPPVYVAPVQPGYVP